MFNNLNILFFIMMILSTILSISSYNWFSMWMGLEINMISFIPLLFNMKNPLYNESMLKYFIIQAMASSSFLFLTTAQSFFFFSFNEINNIFINFLIMIPLLMKLGCSPFQTWFIMVMQSLDWQKSFILLTWQKIAPLFILFYLMNNNLVNFIAPLSLIFGALAGLNQTSIKKIIAYSSVTHLGWLLSSMIINKFMLIIYFVIYSVTNLFIILNLSFYFINFNQLFSTKLPLSLSISLLSLAGMPPLLGFLPKWFLIQILMQNNLFVLCLILISSALITLTFYFQLLFVNVMMLNSSMKWNFLLNTHTFKYLTSFISSTIIFSLFFFYIF